MRDRRSSSYNSSRRGFMRTGLGVAGGLALPMGFAQRAWAAGEPAMGTWPAGSQGDTVYIGASVPLTGTYAVQGEDELKGWELAVEHINSGHDLMKKIAPKTNKGVLGKQVKLYVAGISGSNDTTGKDCVRYGFRQNFFGQTAAAAIAPVLVKQFGKNKKVAYMTPDYTYGHTVTKSMQDMTKDAGWTTVTNQVSPLGAPDFSSYLLNVANSGADLLINVNWGHDAVLSIQQAKQFGVLDKMKLVVPYQVPFLAREACGGLMSGVYAATD